MKLKIITGFRKDQAFSVDQEEAHKAYFLFFNPEARTVFKDGLAIKGSDIQRIEPDYQDAMGWNPTHTLGDDDFNEIKRMGVDTKLRQIMGQASWIGRASNPEDLKLTFSEALTRYPQLEASKLTRSATLIGE